MIIYIDCCFLGRLFVLVDKISKENSYLFYQACIWVIQVITWIASAKYWLVTIHRWSNITSSRLLYSWISLPQLIIATSLKTQVISKDYLTYLRVIIVAYFAHLNPLDIWLFLISHRLVNSRFHRCDVLEYCYSTHILVIYIRSLIFQQDLNLLHTVSI